MTISALILLSSTLSAQQVADTDFAPPLGRAPLHSEGKGPLVLLDQAHFNFHTADGRYLAFAKLLRRDGYRVEPNTAPFTRKSLAAAKVLVISNALNEANSENWSLPRKSAFTADEIRELVDWIRLDGGRLFLIADHMPFAGAAMDLAKPFGIEFTDGYVSDPGGKGLPDLFTRANGQLKDHPVITKGVESIGTFTGSAFRFVGDTKAEPILVLGPQFVSVMPEVIGKVDESTPRLPVGGWLQGAVFESGKGKVAVFGEAAMFSAQLAGPNKNPMGMNNPKAPENPKLLLNLIAWLTTTRPADSR